MELEQIKLFISLFLTLSQHEWDFLSQNLRVYHLKKGEKLQVAGTVCNEIAFCNKGVLRAYYMNGTKQVVEEFFTENNYVADYTSFLYQQEGVWNIEALSNCELILLSYEGLQKCYETFPSFQKYGRIMAEYLFIRFYLKSNSLLIESPQQRFINLAKSRPDILQRVPQYMIASYLGITPEALSRIKSKKILRRQS